MVVLLFSRYMYVIHCLQEQHGLQLFNKEFVLQIGTDKTLQHVNYVIEQCFVQYGSLPH